MDIGGEISKAIKENKWLDITYQNQKDEITRYWIAVKNINFERKILYVAMFNPAKSLKVISGGIHFDKIKTASVIDFTHYFYSFNLTAAIEANIDKCDWLHYDRFNHNILDYFGECFVLDNDPCEETYVPIEGIDLYELRKNKKYLLNEEQTQAIIRDIYQYDLKKADNSFFTPAINRLSIADGKKKYVICYYELKFNPVNRTLICDSQLRFNKSFLIEGRRHSLFNYINMDPDLFTRTFFEYYREYRNIIFDNLRPGEKIDTMPDIMLLKREISISPEETFREIKNKYLSGNLNIPMKAFFGNITKRDNENPKEPILIGKDRKINVDQMRVVYNAMKYPVTYVQGPPGTGKTQTILNIVLNAFYDEQTVLVCSSANKPVDGIAMALDSLRDEEKIDFPFLRLGNFEDVKKATRKINKIYLRDYDDKKEEKCKRENSHKNKDLIALLKREKQKDAIGECLESASRLLDRCKGEKGGVIKVIKKKIGKLRATLCDLSETPNDELFSLMVPLSENRELSRFLRCISLSRLRKLKEPRFRELVFLCSLEDDNRRALEFNKWLTDDENMRKLTDVFPVILSTNISTYRLGTPGFSFDKVIMDEASQCNAVTALIPIVKAKTLVLVGDPNQLKPIVVLEDETNERLMEKYGIGREYNYKTNSIFDMMMKNDRISEFIFLKHHYRSGKKIIAFSNRRFYQNKLDLSLLEEKGTLELLNVANHNRKQRNEAYEEAKAIAEYIKKNKIKDAFIITPFVNQKELLNKMIKEQGSQGVECGTIHSLQGAEQNTIIFSPAVSPKTSKKTFAWLKDNKELINVAVTRARSKFVIAADTEAVNILSDGSDDLSHLIRYIQSNGKTTVPESTPVTVEIGKSNASFSEDEFYRTVSHFCSCHKNFGMERNVKAEKLFRDDPRVMKSGMEFDSVLYENRFFTKKPVIVFEINGGEHLIDRKRQRSDRLKMQLCREKGIKHVIIPNSFVREYEYIAEIIFAAANKKISIRDALFSVGK